MIRQDIFYQNKRTFSGCILRVRMINEQPLFCVMCCHGEQESDDIKMKPYSAVGLCIKQLSTFSQSLIKRSLTMRTEIRESGKELCLYVRLGHELLVRS